MDDPKTFYEESLKLSRIMDHFVINSFETFIIGTLDSSRTQNIMEALLNEIATLASALQYAFQNHFYW